MPEFPKPDLPYPDDPNAQVVRLRAEALRRHVPRHPAIWLPTTPAAQAASGVAMFRPGPDLDTPPTKPSRLIPFFGVPAPPG